MVAYKDEVPSRQGRCRCWRRRHFAAISPRRQPRRATTDTTRPAASRERHSYYRRRAVSGKPSRAAADRIRSGVLARAHSGGA